MRYRFLRLLNTILALLAIVACASLSVGCVERTISLTSEPEGALVYLNNQEVGRTPVSVPFTFYGKYNVRLEHDGYNPLFTQQDTAIPWWEVPGPDLIGELIPHNRVNLAWHFKMTPEQPADPDQLIEHASQLRAQTVQPKN